MKSAVTVQINLIKGGSENDMIARILTTNTVIEVFPTMSPYSSDKFYTTQNGMVFNEKDLEILNGFELKRFNEQ